MKQKRIGSYFLKSTLKKGLYWKLKLARHIQTGETVVLKIFNRHLIPSEKEQNECLNEIQILKKLHHPHLLRLYEVSHKST
jgi:serine/threonine protein kinase